MESVNWERKTLCYRVQWHFKLTPHQMTWENSLGCNCSYFKTLVPFYFWANIHLLERFVYCDRLGEVSSEKNRLLVTDISTTWAEVIFKVEWKVFVSASLIGQSRGEDIGCKARMKFVIGYFRFQPAPYKGPIRGINKANRRTSNRRIETYEIELPLRSSRCQSTTTVLFRITLWDNHITVKPILHRHPWDTH